jgi:hypothetical protein
MTPDGDLTKVKTDDLDRDVAIPGGQTISSLERDARAVQLHAMRYSYSEIATALGYDSRQSAHKAVKRAHERILTPAVKTHVATSLAELDAIIVRLIGIMHRRHVVVAKGEIVRDEAGNPMVDSGPELAALAQWRQATESRRKLLGLDAAVKIDVNTDGMSDVDVAIQTLVAEMERNSTIAEQRAARGES